jgi:hypothetical protein
MPRISHFYGITLRLVQDWAELHTAELEANWRLVLSKKPPDPIDPLG